MTERNVPNGSRGGAADSGVQWAPALGGGALLLYAAWRRSLSSPLLGAAGAALLYRGVTGQNPAEGLLEKVSEQAVTGIHVHKAVSIQRTPEDVYRFWRRIENLPRFMEHLKSVEELGDGRSRWEARIPGPVPLSWEARVVRDEAGEILEWETVADSAIKHEGQVRFIPKDGGQATELHVSMSYRPPLGVAGVAVAQLLNAVTEQQIKEEIRHCKQLLEAGEIPTVKGQPSGRASSESSVAGRAGA
jgi:uncharacterized membrane protein